jgi:hypothetical protein
MVNDMIVAVEDLRSVEFTLMPVEKKRTGKKAAAAAKSRGGGGGGNAAKPGDGPAANSQGGGTTVRWGKDYSHFFTNFLQNFVRILILSRAFSTGRALICRCSE